MNSITMGDHAHQPSNSTEEIDLQEQDVVAAGGRLYECIFCKRGFTTAQALGGHMNIHRKDRAKGRPNDHMSNSISSKLEDHHSCYAGHRFYQPVFASYPPSYISAPPSDQEGPVRYRTYFSSTSSTVQPINYENDHQDVHGVFTGPSSLRLRQFGWSSHDQNLKRTINLGGNEEDELDLELRLGHDP